MRLSVKDVKIIYYAQKYHTDELVRNIFTAYDDNEMEDSKLKQMGFELYLVSNANYDRVKLFSKRLGVEGVPRAEKPYTKSLKMIQKLYSEKFGTILLPTEMAHVGNSMAKDVATGNSFGIITCLVRDAGNLPHIGRMLNPKKTDGQIIRDVLLERGIWRKHHYKSKDDQYYQLNEKQISFID